MSNTQEGPKDTVSNTLMGLREGVSNMQELPTESMYNTLEGPKDNVSNTLVRNKYRYLYLH